MRPATPPTAKKGNRRLTVSSRTPAFVVPKVNEDATAPDERTTNLLLAAEATFSRKGFAATTMDDIAGAAGMSKKTLYKLYDSKTELFRAMLLRS
ncbi:MAG: helix-turn-helix domain-containing protein, partial [Tardiphaga sp.]